MPTPLKLRKKIPNDRLQNNNLYIHSSPPKVLQLNSAHVKQLIRNGDVEKLEQWVLEGHGAKLIGEYSADYRTRSFLKRIPTLMTKISLLHDAVNSGRLEELKSLLNEESSDNRKKIVTAKDDSGVGLLHKAIYYDLEDIYKYLIEKFSHLVHLKDAEGRTAFHYTPMCKESAAVQKLLITAGADSSCQDLKQHTVKYYMNHPQELELPNSLKSVVRLNKSDPQKDGLNFKKSNIRIWIHQRNLANLQQVVWEGHGSKLLVEHSNNAKIKRFLEAVPHIMGLVKHIHTDVQNNDLESLKNHVSSPVPAIVFSSKDLNGLTPLHKAAGQGKHDIAEFIVTEYPQAVNLTDLEGRTPLHYASLLKDDGKMTNLLLASGADESALDNKQKTAAYYKTRSSEIDAKLLNVIPDCPRHAKDTFLSNFDWNLLTTIASTPTETIPPKVLKIFENEKKPEEDAQNEEIQQQNNNEEDKVDAETHDEQPQAEDSPKEENSIVISSEEVIDAAFEDMPPEYKDEPPNEEPSVEEKAQPDSVHEIDSDNSEKPEPDELEEPQPDIIHENENTEETDTNKSRPGTTVRTEIPETETVESRPGTTNKSEHLEIAESRPGTAKMSETEAVKSRPGTANITEFLETTEVEPEGVIEGIVNGEDEIEILNEQGQDVGSPSNGGEDSEVTALIEAGNMEQLAALVLNGDGDKLLGRTSDNAELQSFLDNVEVYMSKINKIHIAAREGSLRDLQAALDRRKFAIAKDKMSPSGASPLHAAIVFGNTSIVRYLAGRFPETTQIADDNGRTALHYAAVLPDNGHYYNLLTHLGADAKFADKFGRTPEYYRAHEEELSHRSLLQEFGAEETAADEILNDKGSIVPNNGNHVDMPFFATEEALGDPLIKGLTEVANKRPKDPIAYLATYLYNFANNRQISSRGKPQQLEPDNSVPATIDVVTVDPDDDNETDDSAFNSTSRDEHGQSMLHFAAARAHGRNALFQLLVETEINVAYRDELYRTARDISIQANIPENTAGIDRYVMSIATKGDTDKLVELLLNGYDHITDIVDENDIPIVELVAQHNQPDTVVFLQSILAFEEKRERVHHAIRLGSINDVSTLLADENNTGSGKLLAIGRNSYGRCSLHIAVLCQQEEIIDYLANTFPDTLRLGDNLERTALHFAMGVENMETISRVLIKAGSKRIVKDLKGRQPTYYFLNKSDILRLQEEEETF